MQSVFLHESLPPAFRAFVCYFKEGTLVALYRKQKYQIKVIQRYLWNWDGNKKTLEEWAVDYNAIMDCLLLEPRKPNHFLHGSGAPYP